MDCSHGAGSLGATGDQQSERLPPSGQASTCFCIGRITRRRLYCWLTAIVCICPGAELLMLRIWTTTCTCGDGATKSGIFTSICQTPTCPGASPEYMTKDGSTN